MKTDPLTLDYFIGRYTSAPYSRQQAALAASIRVLDEVPESNTNEPLLTLAELTQALGFKHYTALHKLKIQRAGQAWAGGRLRYRRSAAEEYLKSPACMEIREELRRKRRKLEKERSL